MRDMEHPMVALTDYRSGADDRAAPGGEFFTFVLHSLTVFSIIGALSVNLFLCFVNTNVMGISQTHVMLREMAMLGAALLAAADRRIGLYMALALCASYLIFIFALRQESDLKAFRDLLIPITFYFLGTRIRDIRLADRLVITSVIIVMFFALFEYFALDAYLRIFNILGYYIARGTVEADATFGATSGLFGSGLRPEARSLLPFLGDHRVSSVFLEPVSACNFNAIVYCWCLMRPAMPWRRTMIAMALAGIVLADARFGFATCIVATALLPFYRLIPRLAWLGAPFLLLAFIASYGILSGTGGGANDVVGRFNVTAHLLAQLSPQTVFGTNLTDQFTADSGLAYTLTSFGLIGFLLMWGAVVYAPVRDAHAWKFHAAMMVYLLMLMLISNSLYSIKTAALMWFLVGICDHATDFRGRRARQGRAKTG